MQVYVSVLCHLLPAHGGRRGRSLALFDDLRDGVLGKRTARRDGRSTGLILPTP